MCCWEVGWGFYLLWRRGQCRYELSHNGFDLRVVLVKMFGQRSHENHYTLTNGVIAGILRGVLQKLLKNWQQGTDIILTQTAATSATAPVRGTYAERTYRVRSTFPCVLRAESAASSMQRRTSAWRSFRASGTKKRKRGVTWASFRYCDSLFRVRAMPHLMKP